MTWKKEKIYGAKDGVTSTQDDVVETMSQQEAEKTRCPLVDPDVAPEEN